MSETKKKVVKKKIKEDQKPLVTTTAPEVKQPETKPTNTGKSKKKRSTRQKVLRAVAITLGVILILLLIAVAILYFVFKHYYDKTNYIPDDKAAVTTMAPSELASIVADAKHDDIVAPIESSVYDELSQTAEATISSENESSVKESIKESIQASEGEAVYESLKESAIDSVASSIAAENPDVNIEDIKSSIVADESIMESVDESAKQEASSAVESMASSAFEEKESSMMSSAEDDVKESISVAASETAESIANSMEDVMESQSKELESQEVAVSSDVFNFLIIGIDDHNYSDTILLCTINEAKHTLYLTSILRDMSVNIPGFGMLKLNNAFRFGGAPMLVSTIEENLKVKIDNYAFVHFKGVWDLFDAAGGIDLDISEAEMENANKYITETTQWFGVPTEPNLFTHGGYQHMTGIQVLSYCRSRYVGHGDMDRTARQRLALTTLFNKLRTFGLGELNDYLNRVLPIVSHNMDSGKVMNLLLKAGTYINYSMVPLRVPYDGSYSISVANDYMVMADVPANAIYLKNTIY